MRGEVARKLGYQRSLTMVVGQASSVTATLGTASLPSPSVAGITGTTATAIVHTSCEVEAQLTGTNFQIGPAGWQPQSFYDQSYLTWTWSVTPQVVGRLDLRLFLDSLYVVDGTTVPGAQRNAQVLITVTAASKSAFDIAYDFSEYPIVSSLAASAITGGAAVMWKRSSKRRRRRTARTTRKRRPSDGPTTSASGPSPP